MRQVGSTGVDPDQRAGEFDELVASTTASQSCIEGLQEDVLVLFHELLQPEVSETALASPSASHRWGPCSSHRHVFLARKPGLVGEGLGKPAGLQNYPWHSPDLWA